MGNQVGVPPVLPERSPSCPSCGREVMATASGQCIYCLGPLSRYWTRIEPERIRRLGEFERVRGQIRRAGSGRRLRAAGAVAAGVLAALAFVGLFAVCMRWLLSYIGRGVVAGE